MTKITENITNLIGESPIVQLSHTPKESAEIYLKLERFNPGGSVKDRIALNMVKAAERQGLLKPGGTIVEPTSGNTGIGLAMVGAALGYKVVIIMPDNYSKERQQLIKAYGAQLVLTPASQGIQAAIDLAATYVREKGWYMPMQFENVANSAAHELTTGPEIWRAFKEEGLNAFVAGAGTGGTISGVSHYLKQKDPSLETYVVEPGESPILSGGTSGSHRIQGIGIPFLSPNLDTQAYDYAVDVMSDEALEMARVIAKEEGILIGISGGAAVWAAYQIAKKLGPGKKVLALCPDSGERYLSTELYS